MNAGLRAALWYHLLVFGITAPLLMYLQGERLGQALLLLTLGYHLGLVAYALLRGHAEWLTLWAFLLPLSLAQVLPDLALARVAGVLSFHDHGQYRIGGAVPVYFAGMWAAILFPLLLLGNATRSRYLNTAALGLLAFALWEWAAPYLQLWAPHNVRLFQGIAVYVLIPEVLLCVAALWMYRETRGRGILAPLVGALCVPVFYAGALFISLTLIG